MEQALVVLEQEDPTHRSQERQNILITLATTCRNLNNVYWEQIKEVDDPSSISRKIEETDSALQSHCRDALRCGALSPHSIDVPVTNLLNRYENTADDTEKADLMVEMLELLEQADQLIEPGKLEVVLRTRMQVECKLDDDEASMENTIHRLENFSSGSGYYLKARAQAYYFDQVSHTLTPRNEKAIKEGMRILTEELGWDSLNNSPRALSLFSRLWWNDNVGLKGFDVGRDKFLRVPLSNAKWEEYYQLLSRQFDAEGAGAETHFFLRFMLGWASFQTGHYKEAVSHFYALDHLTRGNRFRAEYLATVTTSDGAPLHASGEIREIRDNIGSVYFSAMGIQLPFLPRGIGTPRLYSAHEFEIRLSYRLPLAVPVQ